MQRQHLQCRLTAADNLIELPARAQDQIYRIAQEAVSNAVKHAAASEIQVTLSLEGEALLVSVQDNGVGADPARLHFASGYGLKSMQERARSIGADLEFQTHRGAGFLLRVLMPLTGS